MIELMIVVAVLALIALIVVPKMAQLIRKSNEAATRGHLGSVRSALSLYYSGTEGLYPADFSIFTAPGSPYGLDSPPKAYTAEHGTFSQVDTLTTPNPFDDVGRWGYVSGGESAGAFWVQCTHTDLSGKVWSRY
jgi:type II secretory pathway pseudopilin PulG